jgi:ABC-2 type transport system ATP-binding protein
VISVEGLTKRYDGTLAVDDISFEVQQGEILGFLGPNGAGKTTTMKILTCYMPPTSGDVFIGGRSVLQQSLHIRQSLGYLPEDTPLYNFMPVLEYLEFVSEMRGIDSGIRGKRIGEMIEVCGLGDVLGKDIGELSRGYRQRVGLAQALVHDPDLIILDEPTSGLDPNQIAEIRSMIREFGQQKTLILSTHILPEVQATCDRVIIINRGKLVADGSPDELAGRLRGSQKVKIGFAGEEFDTSEVVATIRTVPGITSVESSGVERGIQMLTLEAEKESDPRLDLFRMASEKGWPLAELHMERSSLEDIFRELTVGVERAEQASQMIGGKGNV